MLGNITFQKIKREAQIRYSYLRRLPTLRYLPPFIAIEPTNNCNYKCIMCPQSSKKSPISPRGFMSEATFDRILNEISSFAFDVFIQLGGEPLLHPGLIDFVRKAKERHLWVGLSTNASLLTDTIGEGFIQEGLDKLIISFTDRGKERYEKMWQGGNYGQVEENIKRFLRLKSGHKNPRVVFQIIKFFGEDKNLNLERDFLKTWSRLGVDSFSPIWATYWTGGFKDEAISRYREAPRDKYYRPCGAIWRSLVIHWDGNVSPCCNDLSMNYILGNIEKEPIREIWNGEKMIRLRSELVQARYKEIYLCKNCLALWGRLPQEKRRWYGLLENWIKRRCPG